MIATMASFGCHRLETLGVPWTLLLGVLAGAFITAGALLVGGLVAFAQHYPASVEGLLTERVESKMRYRDDGSALAWLQAVVSGMLANWLVGMAAFFAFLGRTIIGKYIPVASAVTMFVAARFQHSPANMGYAAPSPATGATEDE
ncbi:MAG: formate/nitrite transporter family protein [Egibacteraceae bacterium]